jgi:hypothetical protein
MYQIARTIEQVQDLLERLNRPETGAVIQKYQYTGNTLLDFSTLVSLRRAHETDSAKKAVRARGRQARSLEERIEREDVRERSRAIVQIGNRYEAILREVNKPSEGSGISRMFHWTGFTTTHAASSNALNAAVAAGQRASRVSVHTVEFVIMHKVIMQKCDNAREIGIHHRCPYVK